MRRRSMMVSLASLLAACAAGDAPRSADPGAGQWQPLAPERIVEALPPNPALEPVGGRVRRAASDEIVAEVYLANPSTAPGTNQLTVAVDLASPWTRGRTSTPASASYEIDPTKRLELLEAHFPGEVRAGAAESRGMPGGAIGLLPVRHADGSACVLAWQPVEPADPRWQPAPSRIFKTLRFCAPSLDMDAVLRSFAGLDVYRLVNAGETSGAGSGRTRAYADAFGAIPRAGILSHAIGRGDDAE